MPTPKGGSRRPSQVSSARSMLGSQGASQGGRRQMAEPLWKTWDGLARKSGEHATVYHTNGDRYRGQYDGDMRHGQGTLLFKSGNKYEGAFENDLQHGSPVPQPRTRVAAPQLPLPSSPAPITLGPPPGLTLQDAARPDEDPGKHELAGSLAQRCLGSVPHAPLLTPSPGGRVRHALDPEREQAADAISRGVRVWEAPGQPQTPNPKP